MIEKKKDKGTNRSKYCQHFANVIKIKKGNNLINIVYCTVIRKWLTRNIYIEILIRKYIPKILPTVGQPTVIDGQCQDK